jgi:hypothetical protein
MIVDARQATDQISISHYDRKLYNDVSAALATSKYTSIRRLSCSVSEGVVEISGTVPSFYLKQLAQAAIMQLSAEATVRNLVQVCGESPVLIAGSCDPSHS